MAITESGGNPVESVVAHYESLLQQHGEVPRGVGWNSEAAQFERFSQLSSILPDGDVPLSVLDFGCGFGSFADFLISRRRKATYVGYEASSNMISRARERIQDPRVRFETDWSRVPECDYTVASGLFNVRGEWSEERWWSYILETLQAIHDRTTSGWSANFLTSYSKRELMRPELYYADPRAIFDWCMQNLSRFVALRHDYRLFDFTILVRKDPR